MLTMRNNITFLLFIASLIVTIACSRETSTVEVVEFNEFQQNIELKAEPVEWLDIWNCGDIRIYDSLMAVVDWKRKGGSIRVYNLNTKKLLGAFGSFGKGPGEFFKPPTMTPIFSHQGKDLIIQLYDNGRRSFHNINLTKSLEGRGVVEQSEFLLPEGMFGNRSFITDDSILYKPNSSALHRYDFATGIGTDLHEPIELRQNFPSDQFENIARIMYLEMDADRERIVGCFNVMRRLHIYDSNGDFLRVIMEPGSNVLNLGNKDIYKTNREHYRRSFLSDEYILVLDTDRIVGTAPPGNLSLFSYQGDALINYKIDSWVYYGAVDWRTNTLYTCDTQEAAMISYSLSGI